MIITKNTKFVESLKYDSDSEELESMDRFYEYYYDLDDCDDIIPLFDLMVEKVNSIRLLIAALTISHGDRVRIPNRYKLADKIEKLAIQKKLTFSQIKSLLRGFI